jgi:hypothetical protein
MRQAGYYVNGVRCDNSAASFWPVFLRETRENYPDGESVELRTLTGAELGRGLLDPKRQFEVEASLFDGLEVREHLAETMARMALTGGPACVLVTVLEAEGGGILDETTVESLDSESFVYLAAWMLEWAGVPESLWNRGELSGAAVLGDAGRNTADRLFFDLTREHVSEGLNELCLRVQWEPVPFDRRWLESGEAARVPGR